MITRTAQKFKPVFFMQHNWGMLTSLWRFYGALFYFSLINMIDLGNFFAKTVLAIPAEHDILKYRIFIWGHIGIASSEEVYEYITNPN